MYGLTVVRSRRQVSQPPIMFFGGPLREGCLVVELAGGKTAEFVDDACQSSSDGSSPFAAAAEAAREQVGVLSDVVTVVAVFASEGRSPSFAHSSTCLQCPLCESKTKYEKGARANRYIPMGIPSHIAVWI